MSVKYYEADGLLRNGLEPIEAGDMLCFWRDMERFEHYGICVKREPVDCKVQCKNEKMKGVEHTHSTHLVHLKGDAIVRYSGKDYGYVTCDLLVDFIVREKYDRVGVWKHSASYTASVRSRDAICARAIVNIGREFCFDDIYDKCEHFARWCYEDEWKSLQAEEFVFRHSVE